MKTLSLLLLTTLLMPMGCNRTPERVRHPSAQLQNSIDFHNHAIVALASNPIPLVVRCTWIEYKDDKTTEHKKEMQIVDTNACRLVFRALRTEDYDPSLRVHFCSGHIKICFHFEGKEQEISFDHGVGIKSTLMPDACFRELPKKHRENLVQLLEEHGFTKHQMGLDE